MLEQLYWPAVALGDGLFYTLGIFLAAYLLSLLLATVSGLAALSGFSWLRILNTVYVEIFRGTSLLVQLFFLYYVLPLFGVSLSAVATGIIALALNFGAYGSAIVRSAVGAVTAGQREAGIALGLRPWQVMRLVVFPQAIVPMIPPFGNLAIEMVKATSLLSLITISELSFAGNLLFQSSGRIVPISLSVMIIYYVVNSAVGWLFRSLERRMSVWRRR